MSDIVTITYVYGSLSYVTDVEAGSKIIIEKDPFYISGKKIVRYTGSNNTTYYPGQLITAPVINITLTVAEIADIGYVKVHQNNSVKDISDMIVKIVEKKGKNQPFSYVVVSVLKELFIDANIDLVQKETAFDLNVYGITGKWTYERLEDNDSIYDITLVNNAYYLKTITLLSLLNFEILNNGAKIKLTNLDNFEANITWTASQNQSNTQYGTFAVENLSFTIKRVNTADEGQSPTYDYSLIKVDGNVNKIFSFIVKNVAGYAIADIDFGESPNLYGRYYDSNPSNIYTTQQIDALTPTNISNQGVLKVVSLRLDDYCWNIIQNLALLTDRYAFFDDKAHLVSFDKNYDKDIIVDWEEPTAQSLGEYGEYRPIMALSSNEDQGSQYVLASQKVICEAYETTVAISDTASTDLGKDIVFNSPDNTKIDISQSDNTNRNQQARVIALNSLKRYYKPGDCIRYSICESKFPTPSSTVNDLANAPTATAADQCFKYETTLEGTNIKVFETYFVSKNVGTSGSPVYIWVEYDTDNPEREQAYTVKTCARSVEDRQNNITIANVPLALIETEYPACVTTYTWGMPEFMDEQNQFKELTAVAQDAVLDNTSDTQISSCDASKIVVGNQSISELREDRKGFTGLIMEKNVDNQVYRLVGYHQGVVQAEFNSFGEIQSGGGNVVINHSGITLNGGVDIILPSDGSKIIAKNVVLDSNGLNAYTNVNPAIENPQQWGTNTLSIGASGNIEAGSGAVQIGVIGSNNFVTKNGNTVQCYINSNGELMAGGGAVKLNSSGVGIYNGSTLQTQINTSGDIVAGGTVVLNGNGLIGYYNTPISTATRSIYISKTGSIAIGGNGGRTLQITGGQIKFFADGSVINSDGTVTGTTGAYITDAGMVTGLADGSVGTAQIVAEAVTNAKMALNSVDTAQIVDSAITNSKVANNAVDTAQIVDSAIKEAKLNDNAVTTNKINALAVTTAKIDNLAVTNAKIDALAVTSAKIADLAVTTAKIDALAVTNAKIANASISTAKIQNAAITTALIDNLAVTNAKIDGLAVGKIQTGTLSADCNIILANTGSELLAGPYTPITLVSIPSSSSSTLSFSAKMGTYVLFEQVDGYSFTSITKATSSPSIDWLTQQTGSSYGGTVPVSNINTQYVFSFKFKNSMDTEVSISCVLTAITATNGEKAYRVRLNKDGLFTYDNTGTQVCSVGADGNITGVTVAADHISAGTLTSGVVYAGSINASQITAGSIASNIAYLGTIGANQISTSAISANTISITNSGAIVAGGAKFNSDGVTIDLPTLNPSSYVASNALKFYDSTNQWVPYKLYATYDSTGATSIVKAESKTIGTTIPSKLKMVVDNGGTTGAYTTYTTNYPNGNINHVNLEKYLDADWTQYDSDTSINPTSYDSISIDNTDYGSYIIHIVLENTKSPSVSVITPSDSSYKDCAFVAYMADGTSYEFKSYTDNGVTARGTRYVFTSGTSTIIGIGIKIKAVASEYFDLNAYPVNLYEMSGDGASISMDQEGTIIQGNNTISGQLYQSGGPIYFKGAGAEIPAYFDMPIIPGAVISRGSVSASSITSRGDVIAQGKVDTGFETLGAFACRRIYITQSGGWTGTPHVGDILLNIS